MKSRIVAISVILIAVLVAIQLVEAQSETSYSFTLTCTNVSKLACPPSPPNFCPTVPGTDADEGDWLEVTGKGTFDTSTGAVSGGGTFTHMNHEGTVHGTGTWTITKFVSFDGQLLKFMFNATNTVGEKFYFMGQISTAPEGMTIWTPTGAAPVFGLVQSGCVTIEPIKQDLLAAYAIPILIAIVVIVGVLLLVLRTRKKKT